MATTPTRADKFSFGLWTIGYNGSDPFGGPTRPALDVVEAVEKLDELGAYGLTFHDDDLFAFGSTDAERQTQIDRLKGALESTGHHRADGHDEPVLRPGLQGRRLHLERPAGPPLRAPQGAPQHRPRRRARREDVRDVGWPRGRRVRQPPRTCRPRSRATRRPSTCSPQYVTDKGYGIRFAIEPKPNEPRGDILLPTLGHAIAFIETLERPELFGINPEVGHEQMAGLNFTAGIAQALYQGKLFHIDLNGQRGIKYDQDLVFGHGDLQNAFSLVDLLEHGAPQGGPAYDGPRHFDYKPSRTEDITGVWDSASANMRMYLLLKERAQAFRADPEVQAGARGLQGRRAVDADAQRRASRTTRSSPTASAYEDFDADAYFGGKGFGFVRLQQLAIEHLMGARN